MTDDSPPRLTLRVADNGIGIGPDAQERLFTPFMQAESSTTRRFGGTGLGLIITGRLLTLMDGTIAVRSAPGDGSIFTVCLPVEAVPDCPPRAVVDLSRVECVVVGLGGKADTIAVYLQHAGARVVRATDIASAVRECALLGAPVVVQSGWRDTQSTSLLRAAFAVRPHVRHVLVTRGRRWDVMQPAPDVFAIDGNCLRRTELLQAVAVAAGLIAPAEYEGSEWRDSHRFTQEPLTADEARRQGRLILIAEDDEINRLVIRRQIEILGYAAEVAGDGAEALALWRRGDYPLLLTDVHMPGMDGYALTRAIRGDEAARGTSDDERMPILALTANALAGEATRAREAGVDDYLTKPVKLEVLEAALRRWLPLDRPDTARAELQEEAIPSR